MQEVYLSGNHVLLNSLVGDILDGHQMIFLGDFNMCWSRARAVAMCLGHFSFG